MRKIATRYAKKTHHKPNDSLALHRHSHGYIAAVLEGGYEEASVDGLYSCVTATLIWHPPFHLHKNRFGVRGATVLNLPSPANTPLPEFYRVRFNADIGKIIALAVKHPIAAATAAFADLQISSVPTCPAPSWLTAIAQTLRHDSRVGASSQIGKLAKDQGVCPEHATRRFKTYFGVSPSIYRREHRVRRAIHLIRRGVTSVETAYRCGYADQSHLVKEFRKVTGRTPGAFQNAENINFVQDRIC